MTRDVNIPFRQYLPVKETKFKINVPRRFFDKVDRHFGFEYLTLMPDYYSKQATLYDMDPESESKTIVQHPFKLEFELKSNFHQADHSHTWGQTANNVHIGTVIKSLNSHFDRIKPAGRIYPPIYIDWFHLQTLFEEDNTPEFYKQKAKDFYGEAYDATKHLANIPGTLHNYPGINQFLFPTTENEEIMKDIRIRIHMAPNTILAFSNNDLPEFLGFADDQLPDERVNKQVQFYNNQVNAFQIIECKNEPFVFVAKGARTSKVHVYFYAKIGESPTAIISTTRARERNPAQLADDYNKSIEALAKSCNFLLQLTYNAVDRKFQFKYPNNPYCTLIVQVPTYVAQQLGYDEVERIKPSMIPKAFSKPEGDNKELEKRQELLC